MEFRYHKPNYTVGFIEKVMPHWLKKNLKKKLPDSISNSSSHPPYIMVPKTNIVCYSPQYQPPDFK